MSMGHTYKFFGFSTSHTVLIFQISLFLFNYSCLHFLPTTPPQPQPNAPSSLASTLPLGYVLVSFIVVPETLAPLSPLSSPLTIVRLFLTSMSLIIFSRLFYSVDYVPVKGEVTLYLSLTIWVISLSIMLSTSIHAITKGMSSFFLSAV